MFSAGEERGASIFADLQLPPFVQERLCHSIRAVQIAKTDISHSPVGRGRTKIRSPVQKTSNEVYPGGI